MKNVKLETIIKVLSLTIPIFSFLGAIELSFFYSRYDISIFHFLDPSEILLSFADHLNELLILAVVMVIFTFFTARVHKILSTDTKVQFEPFSSSLYWYFVKERIGGRIVGFFIGVAFTIIFLVVMHFLIKPAMSANGEFFGLVLPVVLGAYYDDITIPVLKFLKYSGITVSFLTRYTLNLLIFGLLASRATLIGEFREVETRKPTHYKFESFTVDTNDTLKLIGKTKNWIILQQKKNKRTIIYSTDKLLSIIQE